MTKILAEHGLRVTRPRKIVFALLTAASSPLSHVEIARLASEIDKVSVYRTVDLFVKLGIVIGVAHGWKQRYELAAPFKPHHHHLHCSKCGKIEEIQSDELEGMIKLLCDRHNFQVTGHMFEVTGVCGACAGVTK